MKIVTLERILKLGLTNFWRNRWLSLAATFVMTITLLTISIFTILNLVIQATSESVKSKIDMTVSFYDNVEEEKIQSLETALATMAVVKSTHYIDKDEALSIWQTLPIKDRTKQLVTKDSNPLPRSLQIKAYNPEDLSKVAEFFDNYKPLISRISYENNKDIIQRLINITKFIKQIGWIISLIFITISVLIILNTIRLTIFTRKDEIEIMKLVGASDFFVRIPFIIEGALYGILASILSTFLLYLAIHFISPMVSSYLGTVAFDLNLFFGLNFWRIFLLQLGAGSFIGIACSLFSAHRYLKV
ncbi:MAG: hypothetical protein COX39_00815 [Candidatus Nealsonbacteria bacterium CG23_combo_of_CG06-09_8_20_14_all_40_13]|uniref:Cell division protein FtsX n=1 Tax=Candidatus Nealsonbacteria bacterium CG23_combo_of_CG06-09_8_20_14_all_40_13 TaxID=1974724 RepID=A0A2G9YRH3_9BACT|nr:MAG: hypothetical protein COX39_00815 [Candidatus Nealsonbacteria bacterium CG23_combo_of_CG06-09_8_20_14_all_40_13]PIR70945.1 MAG: hypothetical protein COU44_02175 [Candidatus Nealsonbacteria bacterium CG10_big_fil_rev_8_21_14_0_10_40_24]PIU43160.1 MAG: hypothetical protein COS97_02470 [Candidatus Nealsonbacteria bacterium CG07_land_8_20_14_0_80_40_10]